MSATATNSTSDTTWVPPSNGIVGGYTGHNVDVYRAMMAFSAIAWYNCAELVILVLIRFKKYQGLYFWSLMISAFAIPLYQIGVWGKMVNISANTLITQTVDNIGWIVMVGGNSLVLYSRLHLITQNRVLLRIVLWGILINTVVMYIPTTTLDYGCNLHEHNTGFCNGYSVMERIQMTMFSLQEIAISGIYLVEAYKYLKVTYIHDTYARRVMYELLAVNVVLILLDVALLSVEYLDLYEIEVTLKGFVYSVKLKLELGVLSRLVKIVTKGDGLERTATVATGNFTGAEIEYLENVRGGSGATKHGWTLSPVSSRDTKRRQSSHVAPHVIPQQDSNSLDYMISPIEETESTNNGSERTDFGHELELALSNAEPVSPADALRPASAGRPPEVSRQSSIRDLYPGRLSGA